MADEADAAQARMELEEEFLKRHTKPPSLEVEPTGRCLNCSEPVPKDHRWCDADCRADWQRGRK